MLIDHINLNHIRIFECVYRNKSMTKAADELYMTQSGVSQHIKTIEDILEIKLFDRIKQRLVPTAKADQLFQKCSKGLYAIEEALSESKGGEKNFVGTIKIGVPFEFGNNIIIPYLGEFSKKHPRIKFKMQFGYAPDMIQSLLTGALDLAFLDSHQKDPKLNIEKVYDEIIQLCVSENYLKEKFKGEFKENKKMFETLDYMDLLEEGPLIKMWFAHHYKIKNIALEVRATSMEVRGISKMISSSMGAGVLPRHLIQAVDEEGEKLHVFKGSNKHLVNTISMATVKGRTLPPSVDGLTEYLVSKLNERQLKR